MAFSFVPQQTVVYVRMPNWIGDFCMCLPILNTLLAHRARVVVVGRPWAADLLRGYQLAGFIPIQGKAWSDAQTIRRFRQQQAHKQAAGLILPDSLSSALTFKLAGLPSGGYRDDGRSMLLKWPITKPSRPMHAVEFWYHLANQVAQKWGLMLAPEPSKTLDLALTETAWAACDAVITAYNLQNKKWVLIAPTATGEHKGQNKVWPYFAELTQALQAQGIAVVMCPPNHEREQALQTVPAATLLPPLSLDAFVALCTRANLVVCNDSGVSHLAAAGNARALTLFGVTRPTRTSAWSSQAKSLGTEGQWPLLNDVLDELASELQPT